MIGIPELVVVIETLALNYSRDLDVNALNDLAEVWHQQVGACALHDVQRATAMMVADPEVQKFPTVAVFRQYVIRAAQERQRAKLAQTDGEGPACLKCEDSGWVWAGTDEDHYEYVDHCPDGCQPPLPGARYRRHSPQRRRKREGHQTTLADVLPQTLPEGVINVTHRIEGDRDAPDPLDF